MNISVADQNPVFEYTLPVLVVGGGACGCVAALAANAAGAEVLLIEREAHPQGTTAMSQGMIAAAGTASQKELGIGDSPDIFFNDIMTKTRGLTYPVIARTLADNAGPTLDWLTQDCDVPFAVDQGFHPSYGNSQYRVHGWPKRGGDDLIGLLHRRLDDRGIDVMTNTRLAEIFMGDDGQVRGVAIEQPDGTRDLIGCETLILASGGFAANRDLVHEYIPALADVRFNSHEGNQGDGIMLGKAIGGALGDMASYQGYAMLADPQGITVSPNLLIEGGLLFNKNGERFVDETIDIAGMMHAVIAQPDGMAWVIYDKAIEDTCSYVPDVAELMELNAPKPADDVAMLAEALAINPDALDSALQDAHAAKSAGGKDALDRDWSGLGRPPVAPLRALRVTTALYHTQGGLQIDGKARVLREDGTPIGNLFAGGGNARAVSGPAHWGYMPAMGLCTAVTLGRVAGMAAAEMVAA